MNIICFGDSNTFGYDPRSYIGERYAPDCRWVDILAEISHWNIRNNSMNGREIPRSETVFSKSTDLLIVMLGTNDLLQGNDLSESARRMEWFLNHQNIALEKILLIAPPPLRFGEWVEKQSLIEASAGLAAVYRKLAEQTGTHFVNAGEWRVPLAYDGVHFTEDGHKVFAEKLYVFLRDLFSH